MVEPVLDKVFTTFKLLKIGECQSWQLQDWAINIQQSHQCSVTAQFGCLLLLTAKHMTYGHGLQGFQRQVLV